MNKNHSQWSRFGYALEGWKSAWRSEVSFRIEVAIAAAVFTGMAIVGFPVLSWLWVILAAALIFMAELLNSAIEALCDAVHPDYHPLIKVAKDCAASAVLTAVVAGAVIFSTVVYLRWH